MAKRKIAGTKVVTSVNVTDVPEVRTTRKRIGKAYELLADQPTSLAGMSAEERGSVVVSAVLDDDGNTVVLSRVNDLVWEMWPFVTKSSTRKSKKRLDWSGIPEAYREACQNVLYRYWKVGRPGWEAPEISTLYQVLSKLCIFCRFVAMFKLKSLADVGQFHIANFVAEQKREQTHRITKKTVKLSLASTPRAPVEAARMD